MSSPATSAVAPTPNTDLAIAFLINILDKTGRHDLFAIHPTLPKNAPGQTEGATFLPGDYSGLRKWIDAQQGKRGIYVAPNPGRNAESINWRLSKNTIGTIRAIYVDIDPEKIEGGDASGEHFRKERVRLFALAKQMIENVVCPPSLIVDTGGGMQAWWVLNKPILATPDSIALAEGIGRTVQLRFGGDSVFDVCHLMRLPGTINLPNAIKMAQGRGPALATIDPQFVSNKRYTIDQIAEWAPPVAPEKANPNDRPKSPIDWDAIEADTYDELPRELRQKFEALCTERPAVAKLWNGEPAPWQKGLSPSEFEFALAWILKRSGAFTSTEFAQLHATWDHQSINHAGDRRSVQRAWDNNPDGNSGFDVHAVVGEAENIALVEPTDLWAERFTPADLPEGVVPHVIECVARDQAKRLGVEAGAPAAALITAIGSLVPAGNQMQMRQNDTDWKVKPILWTAIIGEPGSNKSATLKYAFDPVSRIESKWAKDYAIAKREYDRLNPRKQKPQTKNAAATVETPEPPLSNSPEDWPDVPREPVMRRKVVQDATTEKLAVILSENEDGLLYMSDELAGFFGSMDTYHAKAGKDRPWWLAAKDGAPTTIDRKSHDVLRVENTAVSVLGGIQPSKINAIGTGLAEDGMLQRFMPVIINRIDRGEDVAPNKARAASLEQIAAALVDSERRGVFKFTPDGDREKRILEDFQQAEINCPGAPSALRQWLEKMPNEFGRLALVFHFIEWHASPNALCGDSPPEMVSGDTARRARRFLMDFAYSHARVFHQSVLGRSQFEEHTAWIGGYILAHGLSVITPRDIYKNYTPFKPPQTRRTLLDILRALESEDWLRPRDGRLKDGHPTSWSVNPAVHAAFAARAVGERAIRQAAQNSIREEGAGRSKRIVIAPEMTRPPVTLARMSPTVSEMIG